MLPWVVSEVLLAATSSHSKIKVVYPVSLILIKNIENVSVLEVMTSMDFQTLPYLYVTISFLLEICFWGPTHPTFSDDVTNFTLFFFEGFPNLSFWGKKFQNKIEDL